jgi:hypothetical protein
MNGTTLQARIYSGYAKAAQRIGLPFDLYRPTGPTNPLNPANKLATLPASFRVDDHYREAQVYGKSMWLAYLDDSQTQPGDYLVGASATYFVAAQKPLLPVLTVACTRTVSVVRIAVPTGFGALDYGGIIDGTEVPLMTGWPASVLQAGKGGRNEVNLPADVQAPGWTMLLPAWPGVVIEPSDIITDDLGHRHIVSVPELTDLGWRLIVQQAVT